LSPANCRLSRHAKNEVIVRDAMFVDGRWLASSGADTIDMVNPATEELCGRVPDGTVHDVDRVVRAACAAFPGWSALSVDERCDHLRRI
jgi:aldehyde dehydrogenase (NAD+)